MLQIQSQWSSATSLTVDGGPQPLPYELTSLIGFVHLLRVPSEVCFEWHGIKSFARFGGWEDGSTHHARMIPLPAAGGLVQFNYIGQADLSCSGRSVPVIDGVERVCDQPGCAWLADEASRDGVCCLDPDQQRVQPRWYVVEGGRRLPVDGRTALHRGRAASKRRPWGWLQPRPIGSVDRGRLRVDTRPPAFGAGQ